MKLFSDIIQDIDIDGISGNTDTEITGIAIDSRSVGTGSVFVAIRGGKFDGHDFVRVAYAKGAAALVVESDFDMEMNSDIPVIKVRDTHKAYALLQRAFHNYIDTKLIIIGVTGTNGKTTTTNILRVIFEKAGIRTGVIGTLGYKYLDIEKPLNHTTPEPGEIFAIFTEMYEAGIGAVAMEVSSHALHQKRVYGIEFDSAVFTNLTQDHLDYHEDMDDYFAAKCLLLNQLAEDKNIVTNLDDPYGLKIAERYGGRCMITYAVENRDADVVAEDIIKHSEGSDFTIAYDDGRYPVKMDAPGLFNVYNALAAFSSAVGKGIEPDTVVEALHEYSGTHGRFEKIRGSQPFTIIVDYAHTPDALQRVTQEAKSIAKAKLIVVFGAGGDRDRTKRPIMARLVAMNADSIVLTSDNPRTEDPQKIIDDVLAGFPDGMSHHIEADRRAAIREALNAALSGDVIVIAGKGHEDYQIIGTEKRHFDDSEVVIEWLRERGYR